MDGRCATCKWWESDERRQWGDYEGRQACALTEVLGGNEFPDHAESKALAYGAEHWSGSVLMTTPDFGCVQWAKKE